MSHKATHWLASIPPESITHGEFRILFHLCDCHNPSAGCFPSQAYLRNASGGSNGGVNKWLLGLEEKGFIKRELDFDPKTKKRKPTQYTLGFEMEPCPKSGHGSGAKPKLTSGNATVSVEPCPNSGHGSDEFSGRNPTPLSGDGANSTFEAKPTPLLGQSQLHPSGVVLKDKPVKEPVKEPYAGEPAGEFSDLFEKFFAKYPSAVERRSAEREWRKALARGADALSIINAAVNYALTKEVKRGFTKKPANWLNSDAWRDHVGTPTKAPSKAEIDANTAALIKGGNRTVAQQVSSYRASELVHAGLITVDDCQRAGVRL